ncbi:uncharacterized protein LOC127739142 [Mytilus californianus]|uniref:uncharacterized protein LOC127739142 n=1 Tax=Mytilus californianus TaxID=6549 RepID=UPI002247B28A|nr:uncharacterized protein LOC127739142 [Mytilus californianus]
MSMLCRWLLANFSYDDNCLTQVLSKSFEIGYNDVIKVISWKITREFYKRFKQSLMEKIVDIYPAYQCHCHCLTESQQCLPVSKKLIVIESIAENTNGIPDTFCNFEISKFKYSEINESSNMPQTEMKDILKKMSDLYAPNSYSMFLQEINGHVASSIFQKHRNLSLICPSKMKSSGYGKKHLILPTRACLQLFCHRKGIIPLGESHFPKSIRGIATDILQGRGHFASTTLRVGDKIGTTTSCGTLGGFYHYFGRYECFITCAHVLLGLSKLIIPLDDMSHNNPVDVIFNQQQGDQICGNLIRRVFNHDDPNSTSIDAALVDIKSPDFKIDENDIIRDNSGSARRCECSGLTTPFVNKNYCDHKFLCGRDDNVTTVTPGAFSGKILNDVKLEHSSAKDVYLKDLGNAAANTNGAHFQPLVMASPAHMQLPVGAQTDRRIFTMYNQMVMNIPLKEGDSGTCVYITGNTPKNTGCVGMANSFCSGSGLSLVTPIEEIIKAMNR